MGSVNNIIWSQLPGETVHLLSVNYVEDSNGDNFFLGPDTLANIHSKEVIRGAMYSVVCGGGFSKNTVGQFALFLFQC